MIRGSRAMFTRFDFIFILDVYRCLLVMEVGHI